MTTTYDLTTSVGKLRLVIGDTTLADAVFTDEELNYFLTENSSDISLSASDALEAWAAKYGASATSENLGDYAYTQKIIEGMLTLAKKLREKAEGVPSGAAAEIAHTDFNYRDIIFNRELRNG